MTGTYEWKPMPHKVEVKCPSCSGLAVFEFIEVVRIALKKDIPFFEKSNFFDYQLFSDSCGHKWHGAVYFAGLHGGSVPAEKRLPEGYSPECWAHSKYLYRTHAFDMGSLHCTKCHLRKKHKLVWPQEAYYSIEYKGAQLWAFNRESAFALKEFVNSRSRKFDTYSWGHFLLHVPTIFKKKNAREYVVKRLNQLLSK